MIILTGLAAYSIWVSIQMLILFCDMLFAIIVYRQGRRYPIYEHEGAIGDRLCGSVVFRQGRFRDGSACRTRLAEAGTKC